MVVKFKNGTELGCSNPVEQKIFKSGKAAGWLCALTLSGDISSADVDAVLTPDNISHLTFSIDDEELFSIAGYSKVTSVVLRHTGSTVSVEAQIIRGSEENQI